MSAAVNIKTQCPTCWAKYKVNARAFGRRARCPKCQSAFRVGEKIRPPTEDDILRWLYEGMEEDDLPVRPRMKAEMPSVSAESPDEQDPPDPITISEKSSGTKVPAEPEPAELAGAASERIFREAV